MGVADPNRQQLHMHDTRAKGRTSATKKKKTTIGIPRQYDRDNAIQRQKKYTQNTEQNMQVRRQETATATQKEPQNRRRKRKEMRGKGTDSARPEKKKSKQNQLVYGHERKTLIKIAN